MERPSWVPPEVDVSRPSVARMYDYYLGGTHHLPVDRQVAEAAMASWPDLPASMRTNRAFLHRAVHHLLRAGATQFLDIGAGIPTAGAVHEVCAAAGAQARVCYADADADADADVDADPVAVAHGRALLATDPTDSTRDAGGDAGGDASTAVVQADLREPDALLEQVAGAGALDLDRPVAVLLVAVLHFVGDEDHPHALLARLRDRLAPGSHLAVTHATSDGQAPDCVAAVQQVYQRTPTPLKMRTRAETSAFFDGW